MCIAAVLTVMTLWLLGIGSDSEVQLPENRPVGLAAYTLKVESLNWETRTSEHYRIHYLPGSVAEREADSIVARNEGFLAFHLKILGEDKYDKIIDVFYFDSRSQIEQIVSKPFRALADAASMTVLAVINEEERARDAHEIMHVVSFDLWGGWETRSELAWLGEGLATYSDVPCNGYKMSLLAAHILRNTGEAVPLDSLAGDFRQYPEMIGYPLMASFVEFVLSQYGLEAFRQLWEVGYGGLEKTLGASGAEIEKWWHEFVAVNYPEPIVPDWPELREHGCR